MLLQSSHPSVYRDFYTGTSGWKVSNDRSPPGVKWIVIMHVWYLGILNCSTFQEESLIEKETWHVFSCSTVKAVGCVRTVKTTTWFDEHLTEENQAYMRNKTAEEFRRQTAEKLNPLKDEPWERHEWTEGRCHDLREHFPYWVLFLLDLNVLLIWFLYR